MPSSQKIKMKFTCNQDWNAMDVTERGRFCQQCKKEVVDFTRNTEKEIQEFKAAHGSACGVFTAEQVYDDIIAPISLRPLKKYAAAAATLLALQTTAVIAQQKDSVKTEQVQTWKPGGENKENICLVRDEEKVKKPVHKVYLFNLGRREFYLTRKFPFIHSRRWLVVGAYF
jgi:hypothetical protein